MAQEKEDSAFDNLHKKLIIPGKLKNLEIKVKLGKFINNLILENNLRKTLEVGFGLGASSAYIINATKSRHITIDPFYKTAWNSSIGKKNIQKLGFTKLLKYYDDFSYNVLPQLVRKGIKLDFAFIDGDHKYDFIFIDFFYIDLMLQKGGFILFDDAGMRSAQLVASFLRTNKKNYKEIATPSKTFILFQKTGIRDERPWYHFEEFYNRRAMKSNAEFKKYDIK